MLLTTTSPRRVTRSLHVGGVQVGRRLAGHGAVDDHHEDRRRRRHARADLLARRRRRRHRALHVQRGARGRGAGADRARARRCRSSPTSTSSTSSRWRRWKPASPGCGSTPATSASPSTSRSSPARRRTAACPSASGSTRDRSTPTSPSSTAAPRPRRWSRRRSASSTTSPRSGFDDVKISVKSSNVPTMIDAYRLLSETVDYPLHLGVTEAGPLPGGLVKSTAGIATLLAEGIGDTIRFSLTADPVEEAKAGRQLLEAHGPARAQGPRPHRLPVVRARRGRRDQGRARRDGRARGAQHPAAGRGDGLRRERSR